ncbi:MAG: nitrate/nitrite transporter NrtS [Burkholderiales bacterium]|nr:nitrate/nitrite transporter NrtS [Burkholderiales bacterium]
MYSRRIAWAALKVAFVVGTVLNLINNGQQFWTHHTVNLWQVAMNFVVPFCVSSYSAARNEAERVKGG